MSYNVTVVSLLQVMLLTFTVNLNLDFIIEHALTPPLITMQYVT